MRKDASKFTNFRELSNGHIYRYPFLKNTAMDTNLTRVYFSFNMTTLTHRFQFTNMQISHWHRQSPWTLHSSNSLHKWKHRRKCNIIAESGRGMLWWCNPTSNCVNLAVKQFQFTWKTTVILEKTANLIEMPFGAVSRVDPRNHIVDGLHIAATKQIWLKHCVQQLLLVLPPLVVRPVPKILWAILL